MINTTRRKFLRDASLTATGVCLASQLGATKKDLRTNTMKCAAPRRNFAVTGTITSTQSGKWSDPTTWGGKSLPQVSDIPLIASGHTVVYDLSTVTVAGVNISSGGTLQFDPNNSTTLQTSGNVVVEGTLQMHPASANIIQTLRFINIVETNFVGGGMDVLITDVGLWAMGSGVLDLAGTQKTGFVRAAGNIAAGATTISLSSAPAGWQAGDEISITPTESPTVGDAYLNGFDERTINSISGTSITLNSGTLRNHPQINNSWSAEVINLTRNVRIEGTAAGRTHIFIRSSVPQKIQYVQIRYIGPRKDRGGDSVAEFVLGRYGIHFHHCDAGSIGSLIEGCVVRDTGSHCYVPHSSIGITMRGNIAYNAMEIAFWWDVLDYTHGTTWDGNLVAKLSFIHTALDVDSSDAPTFAASGFLMGIGDDNVCINNVCIGTPGDFRAGGAYYWMEGKIESAWEFRNNMAHNCHCGLISWQNNLKNHIIEDFVLYNNGMGIYHGAYQNTYLYRGGNVYNSPIQIKASSGNSNKLRFENLIIDAAGMDYAISMEEGPLDGIVPVFIRNCTITGHKLAGIVNESPNALKQLDVVQCTTSGTTGGTLTAPTSTVDYYLSSIAGASENIRVQPVSGQPYMLTHAGKVNIAPFAPTVWGLGNGLQGEYYSDANLSNLVFKRIDSNISFLDWTVLGVHYKITGLTYSVRWTGQVMAQFSEATTFQLDAGGGVRLYINGKLIIDNWQENYPGSFTSSPVTLVAGQKYDVKLEYYNTDDHSQVSLLWSSASLPLEYIPMDQLFAAPVSTPTNQPPVANAGPDQTITLPTNSVTLNGSASKDPDGTIVTWAWTKVAGPSQFIIGNAGSASTAITGLGAGVYVFRLTVTDNQGATASDDVTVTINAANLSPVANAGADINITLPTNSTTLNGGASTDPDGSIVKYAWTKTSGPASYTMADASAASTSLTGLVAGTYVFRLTVTDDKGAPATDDVNVIVNNQGTTPNQPPVANAGADVTITLPASSVTLNGSASKDPDGSIASYAWSKVSGPTQFLIASPGSAITIMSNLVVGTYIFRLTVTDDKGASGSDDVTVLVLDSTSPGNQAPVANAGTDVTVQLPTAGITLDGSASYDADGTIVSYKWTKISGPSQFTLLTPSSATTVLNNMVTGTYVFRLTVTDDKGATGTDTVTVTVLELKAQATGVLTMVASPNPTTSAFKLKISSSNSDPVYLYIYDSTGKFIKMYQLSSITTFTLGYYYMPGLYTAVAVQGAQKVIVKLLKH